MAEIKSLGVHNPVALPYLIAEGLLPQDPGNDLYQWETYVSHGDDGDIEEQVLATKTCVVWSQGHYIRNVFRFELEGEDVVQALLTTFPTTIPPADETRRQTGQDSASTYRATDHHGEPIESSVRGLMGKSRERSERALMVVLKSKAHVYLLHGASHIIDLPFEIARVFPCPRGVLLQRKAAPARHLPSTPRMPTAPPNSFFSSQLQPTSSYLQSPTLARSFANVQPNRPSPLGGKNPFGSLLHGVLGTPNQEAEEEVAALYSLTSPLSDVGVVTYSVQHTRPRLTSKSQPGFSVEFEALGAAEQVVYFSAQDELGDDAATDCRPLILLVTANHDLRTLTLWHAWHTEERSLASLLKERAAHRTAAARRRSSFPNTNMGTGTTTPAVRQRASMRESLIGATTTRQPADAGPSQQAAVSKRRLTRQEEDDAMASQMDPDYLPGASQPAVRESRRISSLNADLRQSQHNPTTSFSAATGRRNPSFGRPNERRSFGHRKSRGSTPGSVYNQSLGPEDDLMDLDDSLNPDDDETVASIVRHIRATFDATGAESLLAGAGDELKRELVVRKLHSLPFVPSSTADIHPSTDFRVVTLRDAIPRKDTYDVGLNVYVHQASTKEVICLHLAVKKRIFPYQFPDEPQIAIPIVRGEFKRGRSNDIATLRSGTRKAVLLAGRGLFLSLDDMVPWPLPRQAPYRAYHPQHQQLGLIEASRDIGRNRILESPLQDALHLVHTGLHGRFDECTRDGVYHRRQLSYHPRRRDVAQLLRVCELVLPTRHTQSFLGIWCIAHARLIEHPGTMAGVAIDSEWVAMVTSILSFLIDRLDGKAQAALRLSRVATGEGAQVRNINATARRINSGGHGGWSWMHNEGHPTASSNPPRHRLDQLLVVSAALALELQASQALVQQDLCLSETEATKLLLGLHIFREEQKLHKLSQRSLLSQSLAIIIAQIGDWLGLDAWSQQPSQYYQLEGARDDLYAFVKSKPASSPLMPLMDEPVGVFHWFEHAVNVKSGERYPTLDVIATLEASRPITNTYREAAVQMTKRIAVLSDILEATTGLTASSARTVELMLRTGLTSEMMETMPEACAAPFREAVVRCEQQPPTTWSTQLLSLVGRDDLIFSSERPVMSGQKSSTTSALAHHDVQAVCHALDQPLPSAKTKEAGRHAVSQLIFHEDRRLVEATSLMHFNSIQMAECPKQPDWTDAQHFEQQRKVMQWVTIRMIALPAGDAMIHYDCQTPLLTDKYHLSGFSNSCSMQPMGHTLTTDRGGLTEEKVNWAYFHAGASAGLRISRQVTGIDTSWIAFNKPNDLTNRHAGLLLALGLNGHLRHVAKWLSFKYLTPKHSMTSVGLLLGLSASYMGTMDGLITRMLSVHITRMLPPGAAELNVSPLTQTAGLIGIGLLYYNTQHRRMSEIMLSEVEHMELEDPDSGPDPLRDECYRLAAGFALGYVNLGKGGKLGGLHGMYLPERLLAIAVGPRPVNAVHVFDRATAGAIIALALVYMKSGDKSIARKVDIPDTEAQFDHVRPDMLMLRAMAKHLILWDDIKVESSSSGHSSFIRNNLPSSYKGRYDRMRASHGKAQLESADVPFFNVTTGLAWALSLRYAGSGNSHARDEILATLDIFHRVRSGAEAYYYDAKLARATVRRCIDVLALAAATVMAGTGDLKTFRYLRRLHGRTDPETPYGSHLAAHLAIGALFLGGGTYTFSTSNVAIASLICSFYPLFPTEVQDNHVHLQALRHFWIFAAEARCLVVEEIDSRRPISMSITVSLKDGSTKTMTAPCLLPELDTISTIQTNDPAYWRVTLDFAGNPEHLAAFRKNQQIFVRQCPASEAHESAFSSTLAALNPSQTVTQPIDEGARWEDVLLNVPTFKDLDKADVELVLPAGMHATSHMDGRGTVVDDRMALKKSVEGSERDDLWNLRVLFAWAEAAREKEGGGLKWFGDEAVDELRAKIEERVRSAQS